MDRKILALTLAMALCLSAAGCSGSSESDAKEANGTAASETTAVEAAAEVTTTQAPDMQSEDTTTTEEGTDILELLDPSSYPDYDFSERKTVTDWTDEDGIIAALNYYAANEDDEWWSGNDGDEFAIRDHVSDYYEFYDNKDAGMDVLYDAEKNKLKSIEYRAFEGDPDDADIDYEFRHFKLTLMVLLPQCSETAISRFMDEFSDWFLNEPEGKDKTFEVEGVEIQITRYKFADIGWYGFDANIKDKA